MAKGGEGAAFRKAPSVLKGMSPAAHIRFALVSEYDPKIGDERESWVAVLGWRRGRRTRQNPDGANNQTVFYGATLGEVAVLAGRFVEVNEEAILNEADGRVGAPFLTEREAAEHAE